MATLLKNMKISHISLVGEAANGVQFVYKSASLQTGEELRITCGNLSKSSEHKMVYGVVYSPQIVDSQLEYSTADEIEKAAHGFLSELNQRNVDVEHSFKPEGAYVAESWLLKGKDPRFPDAPEGTWLVGIKVTDAALWKSVKEGAVTGLSMAGVAEKVRQQPEENEGVAKSFLTTLTELIKGVSESKAEKPHAQEEKVTNEESITKAVSAAMAEALKPLSEKLETMEDRLGAVEKSRGSYQKPIDTADDVLEGVL